MRNLKQPPTEREKRAVICDDLFHLHNQINVVIGGAVKRIMAGSDIKAEVAACCRSIIEQAEQTAERIVRSE